MPISKNDLATETFIDSVANTGGISRLLSYVLQRQIPHRTTIRNPQ
jgi:hypothetical protein